MEEKHVVTCFLEHEGKIAIVKRSQRVGSYRGRWAGISGYIEEGNTPIDQAFQEMKEETGLEKEDIQLIIEGNLHEVNDLKMGRKWIVHPFRFRTMTPDKIALNWENTELRWIYPRDIGEYETVPNLRDAWEKVADI